MQRIFSYLFVSISALWLLNGCNAPLQERQAANAPTASSPPAAPGGVMSKEASYAKDALAGSESEQRREMMQSITEQAKSQANVAMPGGPPGVMPGNAPAPRDTGSRSFGGSFGGASRSSGSFGSGRAGGAGAIAATPPPATYNPNMYISSTYIGGTGAKDRLEKLISEGVLVDGKRVKLEAFSRNYAQAFPIPTNTALNVFANTERAKIVTQGERTFLQIGVQAKKGEAPRRPPLNVALVIDISGSMLQENKLEHARTAALNFVKALHPNDILSIVAFDDNAHLLLPAQQVANKSKVRQILANLASGSGTNIYDGLKLGYREVGKNASRDGVSLVILLSDGEVTTGVNDPIAFQKLAAANVDRDIQTTSIGMGIAFNEDLMLSVAREGKGNYHFLKDGTDAEKVFAKELDELTHVVARAVRLRIKLAEGVGLVRVLGAQTLDTAQTQQVKVEEKKIDRKVAEELGIGMNRQKQKDDPGIKLLIPNFYHGDNHIVMLEVQVPPGNGKRKVADVFLKYKDLTTRANRETTTAANITYTPNRNEMIASVNRSVKKNLLGFQTGEALAQASNLIAAGQIAEAVKKVDERMVVLGVAAREWNDRDLDQDGRMLDRYKTVLAQLNRNPHLAQGDLGDYLKKSLTYAGYQMTK